MNMRFITFLLLACLCPVLAQSQVTSAQRGQSQWTAAEIYAAIGNLGQNASALYIAAHPDDENTRLISYLSNKGVETTYLSLTRGDGGQNRIGPELRELLGVLRTEELLAARSVDGGQQRFTRANDFGYSKHPDETLEIWNKDSVLADMVWTIRSIQPQIIINRFDHRSPGTTHGHHTASAMLSLEAAELAADPEAYAHQLRWVDTWEVSRVFFNTSWWFYGSREAFADADKSNLMEINIGEYFPWLGKSNNEIASESRSMHKCQAFGSTGSRGDQLEYLEWLSGKEKGKQKDQILESNDPFYGINQWPTLSEKQATELTERIKQVQNEYSISDPGASIPTLLLLYKELEDLGLNEHLIRVQEIIEQCMGLFVELKSERPYLVKGDSLNVTLEFIARSVSDELSLETAQWVFQSDGIEIAPSYMLAESLNISANQKIDLIEGIIVPENLSFSTAYWLTKQGSLGMYAVDEQDLIGKPRSPRPIQLQIAYKISEQAFQKFIPLIYKENDPVRGEVYNSCDLVPEFTLNFSDPMAIFSAPDRQSVAFSVQAHSDGVEDEIVFDWPVGWKGPKSFPVKLEKAGQIKRFEIDVTPPTYSHFEDLKVSTKSGEKIMRMDVVDYDHVLAQAVLQASKIRLVRINMKLGGTQLAYLEGAGDALPQSLEAVGYSVNPIQVDQVLAKDLAQYDAIIVGVRAFNTVDELDQYQQVLWDYAEAGGVVLMQYNTSFRLVSDQISPYNLKLSRGRVTDESAKIEVLKPEHPAMNFPNEIGPFDFDYWVQERGLYFPGTWEEPFEALWSSSDSGEEALQGGLLVAPHGDGYLVYTGYSFFRQLPAGVPGAYRIVANLLALGSHKQ